MCLHIMAPSAARAGSFATSSVTTFIHFYFLFEGKNQQSCIDFHFPCLDTRTPELVVEALYRLEGLHTDLGLLVNTSVDEDIPGNPCLSYLLGCCVAEPKGNPG